jgi:predicted peptidase
MPARMPTESNAMKKQTLIALLVGVGLLTSYPATLMAQKTAPLHQEKSFKAKIHRNVTAEYLLFLPRDYDLTKSKRWPLILFLHGAGERGTNLARVKAHGPPRIVPENPEFPFVVVSPQCPAGQRWDSELLLALLDGVVKKHRVDRKRIYLTGLSMGGFGTWNLGLTHPDRFAAIAPICGGGDPLVLLLADPRKSRALKSLPVWAFHGARDPVVKVSESERMVDAMRQMGATEVKLTVYPDAEHDSWTETYNNSALYDWFLSHSR